MDEILARLVSSNENLRVSPSTVYPQEKPHSEVDNRREQHDISTIEQEIHFRCLQGWFFRCSWFRKFEFVLEICGLTTGTFVLEQVLKCIDSIFCKDVVDSFARDRIILKYDVVPTDDSRALNVRELNVVRQEDALWFVNLDLPSQIEVITTLLKLGGGGLIFNVYREIDRMYKENKEMNMVLSAVGYSIKEMQSLSEEEEAEDDEEDEKFLVQSQNEDEYERKKAELISHRNRELSEFKKKYGIIDVEEEQVRTSNTKKKESAETVDYIQLLPLWLNRKIMLYLNERELTELKKTGKYWARMIEDALRESAGRSVIDAKIKKITGEQPEKVEEEDSEDNADSSAVPVLGRDALLKELNLKKRDIILMRNEKKTLRNEQVRADVWEEMCYEKLCCCCVNEVCKLLALATPKKIVLFYSLRTGARTSNSLTGFPAAVTSMAIHNEGFHIVVGCENGALLNMSVRKNEKTMSYNGHSGAVIHIHVTDDRIVSASEDKTIKHFHLWSGLCLLCVNINGLPTSMLTLERDSEPVKLIVGTGEGKLVFADLGKKKIYGEVSVHDKKVTDMTEDRGILMTSSSDKTIRLWSLKILEHQKKSVQVKPFIIVRLESAATAIDCVGNHIFAACADGKLRLISKLSGATTRVIEVTQKKPIAGIYVMQEKDTTKMIMWHESGIEMRAISFGKSSPAKKKGPKSRRDKKPVEEKHSLASRKLFRLLPTSLLHCTVPQSHSVKRLKTNNLCGIEKAAVDRSCTLGKLRLANSRKCELFRQDVFTTMLRECDTLRAVEFELKTFPRVKDKCGFDSSFSRSYSRLNVSQL